MLTNLDWLEPGKPYPPLAEKERLELYARNEALFLSQHDTVWQSDFDEMARLLGKRDKRITPVFGYHQLLSKKTADFVCGEPPKIEIESNADELTKLIRKQQFNAKLYEGMIDVSRFGNGVIKLVDKRITVVPPKYWYPVVNPADLKHVTHHVISFPINPDTMGNNTTLYTEIHTHGMVEIRFNKLDYAMDNTGKITSGIKIGSAIKSPKCEPTGLDDYAIQPLCNVTHSGSLYGLDDYTSINNEIKKIIWRMHCIDTVLNKHSEPSMSGPSSALTWNEHLKSYYLDLANYFKRDSKEDPDLSYITWDGNLDSSFKEIEVLLNQLYIITELGAAFLEGAASGGAISGTALKLRMVSPRLKAQRIVGLNDSTVRNIIAMLACENGIAIDADDLQLKWGDGLPTDPVEDAQRRSVETAGKATKSQYSAIKERGLTDDETEDELEQIRQEEALSQSQLVPYDPTNIDDDINDDEPLKRGRGEVVE